jgi:acyl-CoA synthetase (NDP forming)
MAADAATAPRAHRRFASLDALLAPGSVAVLGASADRLRIGGRPIAPLIARGFAGPIHPVNPNRDTVQGLRAVPLLADVPGPVEAAIIAVPGAAAEQAVEDCIAKGVKAAIMFTAGFAEVDAAGAARQARSPAAARAPGLPLPPMPAAAQARLRALVPFCNPANPVDCTAQAVNDRAVIGAFAASMLGDGGHASAIAFFTQVGASASIAPSLRAQDDQVVAKHPGRLFVLSVTGRPETIRAWKEAGHRVFEDPTRAVAARAAMSRFGGAFARPARRTAAGAGGRGLGQGGGRRRASRLSRFAAGAGPLLRGLEVNPILVLPEGRGAVALDAMLTLEDDGAARP